MERRGLLLTPSLFMSHYALIHWLEALGWIGKASDGIQAIFSLEAHVPVSSLSIVYRNLTNLSLG